MSRIIQKSCNQKYCKVCQDAGKPEDIYRSHFTRETRDPNSRITCPTLLALECRYCYKVGHTVKYCSVIKGKNRQQQSKPKEKPVQKPVEKQKSSNLYDCLESDSEEEEIQKVSVKPIVQPSGINYAAALLSNPVPNPNTNAFTKPNPVNILAPWAESSTISVSVPPPPFKRSMRSWADDTDSEDEEDIVRPTISISIPDDNW